MNDFGGVENSARAQLRGISRFFEVEKHFQSAIEEGFARFGINLLTTIDTDVCKTQCYEFITSSLKKKSIEIPIYLDISTQEFKRYWKTGTKEELCSLAGPAIEAAQKLYSEGKLDVRAKTYCLAFFCKP